ncbi:Imm42 family immunity protein [Phytopseudomonas flavescens]|uniref:Imm42 family immunity protein n=1 Tax=Phytopseudomonas flavescens TaxID=29435 RepID=UPI003CC666F5
MEVSMVFGNPHRFAIWVEIVPEWSGSFKKWIVLLYCEWEFVSQRYSSSNIVY